MEFPLEDPTVLEMADFETAQPRDPGPLGMDLMAQMRPNGRVVDHYRVVIEIGRAHV